jgi:chemotaxis protein MotB
MSMAREDGAHETLPLRVTDAPQPTGAARPWLFAGLLLLLSGGLGYHAYTLQGERDSASGTLVSTQKELGDQRAVRKKLEEQLHALEAEHATRGGELGETREKLQGASAELAAAYARLDELADERGEINAELAEFKQMTRELQRMIDSGRLQVTFRRGRMIVELPAQVLFASGSADLTAEGKDALTQVAKSLRAFASRHFIVAGHTDNVPVSGKFASNWELSSARAVTVTSALIKGGLRPENLVAAGYGEFDPVARNNNEAGKQKNRRIELILEPRLHALKSEAKVESKSKAGKVLAKK